MKRSIFTALLIVAAMFVMAQEDESMRMKPEMTEIWDPEVVVITPGETPSDAPSDAIVLFDGVNLESEWTNQGGEKPGWLVEDGCVTVARGQGIIRTKRVFEDFQLHIEWRTPSEVVGESQGRGNSGVFLQGIYEVQVLDNYNNRTYRNGQAGSIYKQYPPLVNACKAPGEWQTYDIIWKRPQFDLKGQLICPAFITVLHNGVVIQNHFALLGDTPFNRPPAYTAHADKGPIQLQYHGNPVRFRNIWVREIKELDHERVHEPEIVEKKPEKKEKKGKEQDKAAEKKPKQEKPKQEKPKREKAKQEKPKQAKDNR